MSARGTVALAWLVWCGTACADARVDYEVQGDCAVEPSALHVSGSLLRFDHAVDGSSGSSLFDGMEETLVFLDHERRTFHEVEVDADAAEYTGDVASSSMKFADKEMAKAQAQMKESCRQLEKQGLACPQMGSMDMQAMIEMAQGMAAAQTGDGADAGSMQGMDPDALLKSMQGEATQQGTQRAGAPRAAPQLRGANAPTKVSDSGRDDNVAGATCRWHEERRGDVLVGARCVAPPAALPLSARDRAGMSRALAALQRYGAAFAPIMKRFAPGAEPAAPVDALILAQRCYDERGDLRGSAKARISQASIDEESLEIPPGYQAMRLDGGGF